MFKKDPDSECFTLMNKAKLNHNVRIWQYSLWDMGLPDRGSQSGLLRFFFLNRVVNQVSPRSDIVSSDSLDRVSHAVLSDPTLEQLFCKYYIFQGKEGHLVLFCFVLCCVVLFCLISVILTDRRVVGALETFSDGWNEQMKELLNKQIAKGSAFQSCALFFVTYF